MIGLVIMVALVVLFLTVTILNGKTEINDKYNNLNFDEEVSCHGHSIRE